MRQCREWAGTDKAADEALRTSGLRWTVTRPGALSDTAPSGRVSQSSATRPASGHTWDATSGPIAIRDAVRSALVP